MNKRIDVCQRAKNSLLISVYRNAAYVFSETFRVHSGRSLGKFTLSSGKFHE